MSLRSRSLREKDVYQVRQKAKIKIHVSALDEAPLKEGSQVIVAAVDEGLLQLSSNDSWKLLEKMMVNKRGYEVDTYTAQMQVVGKRHFGMKAFALGGGGGMTPTRELFDTLLFWKSDVSLDKNGRRGSGSSLERIPSPLSKSSQLPIRDWTCLEAARARSVSTQDLMILSGLPPLVCEGGLVSG